MFEDTIKKIDRIWELVELTKDKEIEALAKFLYDRISHPDAYVVFLGETSCGKSSIINGLLGENLLPVKANPSTGAITEVSILGDTENKDEFYAINKNATIERLDKQTFQRLCENPDKKLSRLRLIRHGSSNVESLRLFDTPGYGSIVKEHDEVLKSFLPNCDIVVYVINFQIGIQDEDFVFLRMLKQLVRNDVRFFVVVNRCPSNVGIGNHKIQNMMSTLSDVLLTTPTLYLLPKMEAKEGETHVLIKEEKLWHGISTALADSARQDLLHEAFEGYTHDLYDKCLENLENKYLSAKMSSDDYQKLLAANEKAVQNIKKAIPLLIIPTFDKIEAEMPKRIAAARDHAKQRIEQEIQKSDRTDKEDMTNYLNVHLMPFIISDEMKEVQSYIDNMLEDLNNKVDDYIQHEMIRYSNELTVALNSNLDVTAKSIAMKMLGRLGQKGLEGYFVAFGGMGGANAGIANAASHLLKKLGDFVGHTFSRNTHNALKHFLSKIGATSMRAVGAALSVVLEIVFEGVDLMIWKHRLIKAANKAVDKWHDETIDPVIADLHKLRDTNVETINKIADDIAKAFDEDQPADVASCESNYKIAIRIGKELNYINNKDDEK